MVGKREDADVEAEVVVVGKRNGGGAALVVEEREEEEKEGGSVWLGTEEVGGVAAAGGDFPRSDGGIMEGVSSPGRSLPRTFSAMRNMASANCSALSFPLFCVSHKFL